MKITKGEFETEIFGHKIKVVVKNELPPNTFALVGNHNMAIWSNGIITVIDYDKLYRGNDA